MADGTIDINNEMIGLSKLHQQQLCISRGKRCADCDGRHPYYSEDKRRTCQYKVVKEQNNEWQSKGGRDQSQV